MRITTTLVLIATLLALVSCGGSGSNFTQSLGLVLGDYQILDLSTGAVESRSTVADLATNPIYRSSKMVFRAIAAGSGTIGSTVGSFGAQADEVRTTVTSTRYYIGVFEVTRDQWTLLAGTTPWTSQPSGLVGAAASDKPACGLSRDAVTVALIAWNAARSAQLALPTEGQWEQACRAGTGGSFFWGEDRSDATVALYATVSETAGGVAGPRAVGQRSANAMGLYDMHGNIWELTTADTIRGGSWRDTLPMARSANRIDLDQETAHPLVGVRLILSP